jgi:hypothetical protein
MAWKASATAHRKGAAASRSLPVDSSILRGTALMNASRTAATRIATACDALRRDQHLGDHPDRGHGEQMQRGQNHAGGLPAESGDGELVDRPVQVGILIRLVGGSGVIFVEAGRDSATQPR